MKAFYNDTDPFVCAWLSNLMDEGLITPGRIDDRPVQELSPDDVAGFGRIHCFAGIGGWDYALNLADWGEAPVWTGSPPCQPFSVAGQGKGTADERHLWPAWFGLIRLCCPPVLFGEQVEAAVRHGWLDLVQEDLEGEGYAFGAVVLPAASVQAPHIRHRLFFVAHPLGTGVSHAGPGAARGAAARVQGADGKRQWLRSDTGEHGGHGVGLLADALPAGRAEGWAIAGNGPLTGSGKPDEHGTDVGWEEAAGGQRLAGPVGGFWSDCDWLPCRDGKYRPVESGTFPLAHGVSNRMGLLRGYGNAIVPQVAAEFIRAYCEARDA